MALISMMLGSVFGFFAALAGWLLFGIGIGAAFLLYIAISLGLPAAMIGLSLLRPQASQTDQGALELR